MKPVDWFQDSYRVNNCSITKSFSNDVNLNFEPDLGDARIKCICCLLNHFFGNLGDGFYGFFAELQAPNIADRKKIGLMHNQIDRSLRPDRRADARIAALPPGRLDA